MTPVGWVVAVGFGATVATNALGGGTIAASLPVSLAFASWGLRRGDTLGRLLAVTFGVASVVLGAALVTGLVRH